MTTLLSPPVKSTRRESWSTSATILSSPTDSDSASLGAATLLHVESDRTLGHCFAYAARQWKEVIYLGHAATGGEALEECRTRHPEIVLMDLDLPDVDGCELVIALSRLVPAPRTIVLTANITQLTLMRLASVPVAGLISKLSCDGETLRAALREVIAGRIYFSADMRAKVAAFRGSRQAFYKILSDRELELLPLFGAGWDDTQIGDRLSMNAATVRRHRASVLAKLDLHSTPALMRWAAEVGFVSYRGDGLRLHCAFTQASRAVGDSCRS